MKLKRISLFDILADYRKRRDFSPRTEKQYRAVIRQFERWLGRDAMLVDLRRHANAYIEFRINGGTIGVEHVAASKTTAGSHRGVLALLRTHALRRKWCGKFAIRPVRKPRIIPRAFTMDEIEKLLIAAYPVQRAAIMVCFDTGFRRSDIFAAKWSDVTESTDDGHIVTKIVQKTGRVESRRLRRETVAACEAVRKPGDDRLVPAPRNVSNWTSRWQRLGSRAKVDTRRRCLQAVRRSGASYVKAMGGSPQKYLGHSSPHLAEQHYLDPKICGDLPDLPPRLRMLKRVKVNAEKPLFELPPAPIPKPGQPRILDDSLRKIGKNITPRVRKGIAMAATLIASGMRRKDVAEQMGVKPQLLGTWKQTYHDLWQQYFLAGKAACEAVKETEGVA
jgi:integrase